MISQKTREELLTELEELRLQLQEAEDAIQAIRTGQVDALIVQNETGHQLYTLKSADQTYRVFIEKMKEGAITLDKNGFILYSNSQFASSMERPLSSVIGLPFTGLVSPEYRDFAEHLIKAGWESDSKGEVAIKNKNNESIPFLLSISSLELDEGKALSIILTDLSNQKETENELKLKNDQLEEARHRADRMNHELEETVKIRTKDLFLSREHFKFLADNIPVIVWTTDANGNTDYYNKQWFEYSGLSLEQSKNKGSRAVVHRDDLPAVEQAWNDAIINKDNFRFEYRIKRALDGQFRWHLSKAEPFKDDSGNVIAWFGTSTDIEEQKKELEKKDEFISMASHELKTPLTSLKGYIQLMDDANKQLSPDILLYLKKANDSVGKLQHLIDDLLDVSKIHSGKLEFTHTRSNLGKLIKETLENCAHLYPSFIFKKEIGENLFVDGNLDRLEQVLMNLINNAVNYSGDSREIVITASRENEKVRVSVKDFGVGLSAEDKKFVFDRFYRVQSNKHTPGGLGMGLYIAAEIIRAHSGRLYVESTLNQGSVFSFLLPAL